jgi:hypothetical protein
MTSPQFSSRTAQHQAVLPRKLEGSRIITNNHVGYTEVNTWLLIEQGHVQALVNSKDPCPSRPRWTSLGPDYYLLGHPEGRLDASEDILKGWCTLPGTSYSEPEQLDIFR